jgi:hypothetical protein
MNKFLAFISVLMLAAPILPGADEKSVPVPPKTKPAEESASITVKNKSSFNVDATSRNPFWPIGFRPKGHIAGAGDAQGEVPAGAFLVSTITVDGATHFAIINGKSMNEGQQFGLQVGTQVYQVFVKRIEDGRVILGRGEEEIVVPLRRK